jgi:sulfoxide reductase heme-binding subunit YedZ
VLVNPGAAFPAPSAWGLQSGAGGPTLWYLNRASGLVLLVALTFAVVLGQLSTRRSAGARVPRFMTMQLHRNVSLLASALIALHVVTAVGDGYVDIAVLDAVVPFRSPYRPVWLGLGTLALDLVLAVLVTTLLRHRLPRPVWRATHWVSYAAWPTAVLHGLGTGTDTRTPATLLLTFGCIGAVVIGSLLRLVVATAVRPSLRWPAYAAVAVSPLLVLVWLRAGPLQPDWSRRAGTPPPLSAAVEPGIGP